jgi:hypoxanthine phosphoribosyltransferase
MTDHTIREYLARDAISRRIGELADEIDRDFKGRNPLLVCVLKGAMPFFSELTMQLQIRCEFDYVAVSSYESGTESSGRVRFLADLSSSVEDRDVILVEDIVDTGRTISYLLKVLEARGANELEVATLLNKPSRRIVEVPTGYTGFEIEDRFVVGYGMDYEERYRNLPYIGILDLP